MAEILYRFCYFMHVEDQFVYSHQGSRLIPVTLKSKSDYKFSMGFRTEKYKPGVSVVIKGTTTKQGTVIKQEGTCRDHENALVFQVEVKWKTSWWLRCLNIFYCFGYYIFRFSGLSWLFSILLHYCEIEDLWVDIKSWIALFCGRRARVCEIDMELCPIIPNYCPNKMGIQGYNNSCSLDAILFSMFFSSRAFDEWILIRSEFPECKAETAIRKLGTKARQILLELVAVPLRTVGFVPAENVWKLRVLLKEHCPEIMGKYMAPEQIIYLLLDTVFQLPKFLHYNLGYPISHGTHSDYMHIMSVDETNAYTVVTVQENFEFSMRHNQNIKFSRVPFPVLILSWPWQEGKLYHHNAIIPTFELNIKNLMFNDCELCQNENCQNTNRDKNFATWESVHDRRNLLCDSCMIKLGESCPDIAKQYVSRGEMSLTALICYRESHFTTFVRSVTDCGIEYWVNFNTMAGIHTAQNLSEAVLSILAEIKANRTITPATNMKYHERSFCYDAHTCFYEPKFFLSPH